MLNRTGHSKDYPDQNIRLVVLPVPAKMSRVLK